MNSSRRGPGFSVKEDKLLVTIYLDISQNPIIGINQSNDSLWSRVAASYNGQLTSPSREHRTMKALQCRWSNISRAVQSFSGYTHQVELMQPSGASEKDIQPGSTWRLDHVWSLLKDQEKFRSSNATLPGFISNCRNSSQSDYSPNTESPTPDFPGLSGFDVNLDEDSPSGSTQRLIGVKKAKATEDYSKDISSMAKYSEKMMTAMENAEAHRQQLIDVQKERNTLLPWKEENKILRMNPMYVDESFRAYLLKEQQNIWQKRATKGDGANGSSNLFGQFFGGTSPFGSDLGEY
ncbi:uncharacterized protein LOC142504336 [Primulina tabacum]|uniref:uncharacterized protein LOC142504336 n=1 Tax=Primulina tabacum TaxID=48773 RepID=UPI003F59986B